jgi:hypothetical protein
MGLKLSVRGKPSSSPPSPSRKESGEINRKSKYNAILSNELCLLQALHEDAENKEGISGRLSTAQSSRINLEPAATTGDETLLFFSSGFSTFSPWKYTPSFPLLGTDLLGYSTSDSTEPVIETTSLTRVELLNREKGKSTSVVLAECSSSARQNLRIIKLIEAVFPDIGSAVNNSSQLGNIVSFDFRLFSENIHLVDTGSSFAIDLLIYHICWIFQFHVLDDIPFLPISMEALRDGKIDERFAVFAQWINRCRAGSISEMLDEYYRLTKVGFKVKSRSRIVLVFFGVDLLVGNNSLVSFLSQLAESSPVKGPPICIIGVGSCLGNTVQLLTDEKTLNT